VPNPVLSPHHFGEALVQRLLELARLAELSVHDPRNPAAAITLGALVDLPCGPVHVEANAPLDHPAGMPRFDGMHDIDCAVFFETSVLAIELKLGETRLSARDFADRFVSKAPRLTHQDARIAGSMVALLDWNGRKVPAGQPPVSLSCGCRPVQAPWLLLVREATWQSWSTVAHLCETLGTAQLAGVLTLEELARHVGVEKAREAALGLARDSISSWFGSEHVQGGRP